MMSFSEIVSVLPSMKSGEELRAELENLPDYNPDVLNADASVRLMALSDLHRVYIPSQMSLEIYSKLYLALLRSIQKKGTKLAVRQKNQNYRAIMRREYNGLIGGADSFTIIGSSGIGKSSAVSRAISLITEDRVIEMEEPHAYIAPCVTVQCPFDSSVKGLLLEILRKIDEVLDTKYYDKALRGRATSDMLIGSVSQAALNHVGLLVVDEIQNVANNKNGRRLIGALTQLINNSGISICMVGTPESVEFFESAMQLARRSVGLQYTAMEYDNFFKTFCSTLFQYQYVRQRIEISDGVIKWLYERSAGITSIVVSLIHDAQEIAILNGKEKLDMESLNEAYQKRLSLLHKYIQPEQTKKQNKKTKKKNVAPTKTPKFIPSGDNVSVAKLVEKSKKENIDIVRLLKEYFPVMEVKI